MAVFAENARPAIGITIGDAAGIGPEIVLKSVLNPELRAASRCVLIGDAAFLRPLAAEIAPSLRLVALGEGIGDAIEVYDVPNLPQNFEIGVDAAATGRASAEYIEKAVDLWRGGRIAAIATAPISKRAINLGGYNFPGHTEFLAEAYETSISA